MSAWDTCVKDAKKWMGVRVSTAMPPAAWTAPAHTDKMSHWHVCVMGRAAKSGLQATPRRAFGSWMGICIDCSHGDPGLESVYQ